MAVPHKSILSLDVGEKRVGVAVASLNAQIPRSLPTLERTSSFLSELAKLVKENDVIMIIVGLPRGLEGQATQQTITVEAFAAEVRRELDLPLRFQDEALTSVLAENELKHRSKPYSRADIDALAAVYILEDYIKDNRIVSGAAS